jgi:hypothetical protein
MKTIGFKDNAGGMITAYFKEGETRHERIINALNDLKHTGNITVYLINGNKIKKLFRNGM